jgi:glycosyltransferase involved in cell wall biosynthesis
MTTPQISVILPVYNCQKYIQSAIESILDQTFTDFEFIIIDDGSTDASASVIEKIKDPRIRFYKQKNIGLSATLNKGISLAKGEYIARQDQDDISHPTRFEKQVNFLNNNRQIGLVGTYASIINEDGNQTGRVHSHETESIKLKAILYFDNPFVHSSVMFRKESIEKAGLYNTTTPHLFEDFDLWFRVSQLYSVANIPEVLQEYRLLSSSMTKSSANFSELVALQCHRHLQTLLKDTEELKNFAFFYHKCFDKSGNFSGKAALSVLNQFENSFLAKNKEKESAGINIFETLETQTKKAILDHKVYKNKANPLMNLISKAERKLFSPKNKKSN